MLREIGPAGGLCKHHSVLELKAWPIKAPDSGDLINRIATKLGEHFHRLAHRHDSGDGIVTWRAEQLLHLWLHSRSERCDRAAKARLPRARAQRPLTYSL